VTFPTCGTVETAKPLFLPVDTASHAVTYFRSQ